MIQTIVLNVKSVKDMLLRSDSVDWMRAMTADLYDQPFWCQFLLDCKISLRAVMKLVDMTGDAIFTKMSTVCFYNNHLAITH